MSHNLGEEQVYQISHQYTFKDFDQGKFECVKTLLAFYMIFLWITFSTSNQGYRNSFVLITIYLQSTYNSADIIRSCYELFFFFFVTSLTARYNHK